MKVTNGINADLTRLFATVGHFLDCHHLICFAISGLKGTKYNNITCTCSYV